MYHRGRQLLGMVEWTETKGESLLTWTKVLLNLKWIPKEILGDESKANGSLIWLSAISKTINKYLDKWELSMFKIEGHRRWYPCGLTMYLQNTSIWTDKWAAYSQLDANFQHQTVNHQQQFVNGDVHTKNIEREWSTMKKDMIRDA